jgi:D-3-phosphoglycerate dehydrogenase
MENKMFKIQTLDRISSIGLDNFSRDEYEIASEIVNPDAILVRSHDMLSMELPQSVKAIARAGAGTNNIPVKELAQKGVIVFNTPGANSNAVKELVILSLLLASRPVIAANNWVESELKGKGAEIASLAEKGKKNFIGQEVKGKTLGVVGLGAIGAQVANTAIELGMNVIGYDPFLSVDAAWSLSREVKHAETLDTIFTKSDYITVHVPETPDTKGLINAQSIRTMKDGVRIINLARGGLVNNEDVIDAINSGKIGALITDFAAEELLGNPKVVCLPHLGASTPEAEDNCAVMAVKELRDFLETGAIKNSVNYPKCKMDEPIPQGGTRLCICHKNVPNMIASFTSVLGNAKLNISGMIDQNRNDVAYSLIDVENKVEEDVQQALKAIEGVINVRPIYN